MIHTITSPASLASRARYLKAYAAKHKATINVRNNARRKRLRAESRALRMQSGCDR
jgi:hypothetical protein